MGLSLDTLEPPLDDVAFLARSNNRVTVLKELNGAAKTRRSLRDDTDVSKPTLGRILDGFEERGWVVKEDREYRLTPFGRLIADRFEAFMGTVGTVQQLRDLAPDLPLEEMDFDLRLLAAATVTTPSPTDATAHSRRERELLARTDRLRFLCNQAQPETVERYRDWAVKDGRTIEAIIAGDAIDAASADDTMGEHLRDMLAADGTSIYRYEGPVTAMLGLFDDTASIVPLDDAGVPRAFIESDHEDVRAWVSDEIDAYRERARPVMIEDLPP